MQDLQWNCYPFEQLSPDLLYAVLQLRSEVFVVEQNCAYQDMDDYDQAALHLTGQLENCLVCYTRLLPPCVKYDGIAIGRVITKLSVRGDGYGKRLMQESIRYCHQHWPTASITLSAQHYLEKFYSDLGFNTVSEIYMEDGIPHIEMLLDSIGAD